MKSTLTLLIAMLLLLPFQARGKVIRIACVGNSITYGSGITSRDRLSYPAQLQEWLGSSYEVRNFGVSGATLLKNGDNPYGLQPEYQASLDWEPDIVIIKLGTNDSKPRNWQYAGQFEEDYRELVRSYASLPSRPRILVALPVPVFTAEKWGIRDSVVRDGVIPAIRQVAQDNRLEVIDLFNALLPHPEAFPDEVHPNSIGAAIMVEEIYRTLFHRGQIHGSGYLNTAILAAPGAECRGAAAGWGAGRDWFSQFDDINRIGESRQVDLVFLGTSITQGLGGEGRTVWCAVPGLWDSLYGERNAANFGISGDRTQNVLWRIQNGNFENISPKAIVLEIGVNNFPFHNAEEITSGIHAIIKALQKKVPGARILLVGPLPAGADPSGPLRKKYLEVQRNIKSTGGKNITHLDLGRVFIQPDGSLVPGLMSQDAIHLTPEGYRAWTAAMEGELVKIFGK
ncbi:MAG: GDSL-type esterase/lipase family protein [Bacteroidales bacterium]